MPAPELLHFLDYRRYLTAWLEWRKETQPSYSYTVFAEASGLSRSTLPNVLRGARAPSAATLDGFAAALELEPLERNYLGLLVELDRAASVADRRAVMDRILERRAYKKRQRVEEQEGDMVAFAGSWVAQAVHELARMDSFRADPAWIASVLVPPVSVEAAKEALDLVCGIGLLEVAPDGWAQNAVVHLKTDTETADRASNAFHERTVADVVRHLDDTPQETRHLHGGCFAIPSALLPEAKDIVAQAVREMGRLANDPAQHGPRRAYLLAIQLVPMSQEVE